MAQKSIGQSVKEASYQTFAFALIAAGMNFLMQGNYVLGIFLIVLGLGVLAAQKYVSQ